MKALLNITYSVFILGVGLLGVLLFLVYTNIVPGWELLIVQSGSMEPTISTGALVLVLEEERYQVDDIVTFNIDGRSAVPTTHRIVEEGLQAGSLVYFTKGDANNDTDPEPITNDDVIGKVVGSVPFLGYVLDFARQPIGFVLLIVLPALLIVFEEVSTLYREWRTRKVQKNTE